MDLMYICHANFGFPEGARIVQPVPFDPEHVVTRTAIPGHVEPTERYRALVRDLAADPSGAEVLDDPSRFSPEQVFYIEGLTPGADGLVHFLLQRPEGDGFTVAYDPVALPHAIRWLMADGDHEVAAIAMPGTCEPEGYIAESRKGTRAQPRAGRAGPLHHASRLRRPGRRGRPRAPHRRPQGRVTPWQVASPSSAATWSTSSPM